MMTDPPPEPEPGTAGSSEPETTTAAGPVEVKAEVEDNGRKALRRILLGAAIVAVVTVGAGLYAFIEGRNAREIRSVVDGFVTAVDTADQAKVVSLLCQEEAAVLIQHLDEPPEPLPPAPAPGDPAFAREVTEVEVRDDAASAEVIRPDEEPYPLYLRKEAGVWKVCAPVEEQFTGAPPS